MCEWGNLDLCINGDLTQSFLFADMVLDKALDVAYLHALAITISLLDLGIGVERCIEHLVSRYIFVHY